MTDEKKSSRFYVPALSAGEITLPAGESHHARSVRRLGPGEKVELFDGRGSFAQGQIIRIDRRETIVQAGEVTTEPPPLPRVHLAFAVPKGKRLDWLLEKVTELGARSLWPVIFERSVAAGGRMDRWEGHCLSAAKQCRLNWLPELHEPISLAEFLSGSSTITTTPQKQMKLVGDLTDKAISLMKAFQADGGDGPVKKFDDVILLIGPEGGFTTDERAEMAAAEFQPVRLGQTTLRIETAAIALVAAVKAM